ncbi:Chemotaxis regulator - transmits chemoreceptor signals to flagellar motor components CheY [Olavius algarvensis associated proteobacterium Delta 3]|nr:Chemotaxis regulator - transmits chemoreceptor signals to flagellar motor components CheY [Olavius algarvensis associated proteobacterium Delta 3]CAB5165406.1 Chemotaxis regulator - transmits chemoreceptor signals to flagellar motor components CheY [Olavius algarvensis associated proteobacterium Delta 3]
MNKRILIVDDSSMMRKMISRLLTPPGHVIVGEAKNGQEAVTLYQELHPDIVTMDITMRGMDGVTAAREILTMDKTAQIIFLSNLDEEKYRDEVEQLGAVGFVGKHHSEKLLELIDN